VPPEACAKATPVAPASSKTKSEIRLQTPLRPMDSPLAVVRRTLKKPIRTGYLRVRNFQAIRSIVRNAPLEFALVQIRRTSDTVKPLLPTAYGAFRKLNVCTKNRGQFLRDLKYVFLTLHSTPMWHTYKKVGRFDIW
jgi:hypothetical protein